MKQKSMHRCPSCFAALPPGRAYLVCPIRQLADGSTCRKATLSEVDRTATHAARADMCPDHGVRLAEACGAPGCGHTLPDRWDEVTTTALAMAGTRASGKTVFAAIAARALVAWGRRQGITVTHYDEHSRRQFQERYGVLDVGVPLFSSTDPEIPGATTKPHQEPILLRLQMHGRSDHVLMLRDVAGENLQDAVMDPEHFRFLARGDGLILLVDPSDSNAVRQSLLGVVDLASSEFEPDAVWGNLESLQTATLGPQAARVPVAVTLSKFDLVRSAAEQPNSPLAEVFAARGSRMHQDPSVRSGRYDRVDAELLDLELRTLHAHLGNQALLRRAASYAESSEVRMFAVSSLGQPPMVGRVANHGIIPFRCLDPLQWFLSRAGVIETRGAA